MMEDVGGKDDERCVAFRGGYIVGRGSKERSRHGFFFGGGDGRELGGPGRIRYTVYNLVAWSFHSVEEGQELRLRFSKALDRGFWCVYTLTNTSHGSGWHTLLIEESSLPSDLDSRRFPYQVIAIKAIIYSYHPLSSPI